jgi:hypothetical protein
MNEQFRILTDSFLSYHSSSPKAHIFGTCGNSSSIAGMKMNYSPDVGHLGTPDLESKVHPHLMGKRPHSSFGNAPLEEFAAQVEPPKATSDRDLEAVNNGLAY